jgi:phenylpropionate dioxygenase-like ring-hydroxylating dioxygenase large terminal subunit
MSIGSTGASTSYLLAPEAYWSQDWHHFEQDRLFGHTWHLAASDSELSEPGDYVTLRAGYDPLLVVRGLDGQLRCFHNLCRHRGAPLLEGNGNSRVGIRCPYHMWNFALDGQLRNVPQHDEQFASMDLTEWGLLEGSIGTWAGMVFAHPDPDADSAATWLGALPEHIGSYRPELLVEVAHERLDARCNWKLFVENHVDILHLWYLHAQTLCDYDHNKFESMQLGRNWVSYEPLKAGAESALARTTKTVRHIGERDIIGLGAHIAFPNVLMASAAEFFITYVATPVAPDRMYVDLRVRAEPDADAKGLVAAVTSFINEDIAICEAIQGGLRSSRFGVGPMAETHERPITTFQQHLLASLSPEGTH